MFDASNLPSLVGFVHPSNELSRQPTLLLPYRYAPCSTAAALPAITVSIATKVINTTIINHTMRLMMATSFPER